MRAEAVIMQGDEETSAVALPTSPSFLVPFSTKFSVASDFFI